MRLIFDIETNHRKAAQVSRCWCICTLDPDSGQERCFGPAAVLDGIRLLARAEQLIGHNIGTYDLAVIERLYGFRYPGAVMDTITISRLLFNGLSEAPDQYGQHALAAWGKRLGCPKDGYSNFQAWHPDMLKYCLQDCRVVHRMLEHFRRQKSAGKAVQLELEYDAFLRQVERNGFSLDVPGTERLRDKLQRRIDRMQGQFDRVFPPQEVTGTGPSYYSLGLKDPTAFGGKIPKCSTVKELEAWRKANGIKPSQCRRVEGPPETKIHHFNADSHPQVRDELKKRGFETKRETANGDMSTASSVLWRSGLPEARLIVAYRDYAKIQNFTKQWLNYQRDGRIYPRFIGCRAATCRSASQAPNIQQIPSSKTRPSGIKAMPYYGLQCRALFRPSEGYVLIGADLVGIEIRLLGHRLAPYDDGDFSEIVASGTDIHQRNAENIGIARDQAKAVLYGSLYGEGTASLSAKLNISSDEAKAIKKAFTVGIAGFEDMLSDLLGELRCTGRITLIDGRRLEVNSEHKTLNYAIQGDAALLFKHWALKSHKCLADTSLRILAVIHDEIQSECRPDDVDTTKDVFTSTASAVGQQLGFKVKIDAEAKHGRSWQDTH